MKHHLVPLSINSGTGSQMNAVPLSMHVHAIGLVQLQASNVLDLLRITKKPAEIHTNQRLQSMFIDLQLNLVATWSTVFWTQWRSQDMGWAPLIFAPFSARSRCFGSDQSWVSLRFLRAVLIKPTMKNGWEMQKTCTFPSTQPSKRLRFSLFGVVISLKPHWISSTFMPSHGAHCRYTGNKLCYNATSFGAPVRTTLIPGWGNSCSFRGAPRGIEKCSTFVPFGNLTRKYSEVFTQLLGT